MVRFIHLSMFLTGFSALTRFFFYAFWSFYHSQLYFSSILQDVTSGTPTVDSTNLSLTFFPTKHCFITHLLQSDSKASLTQPIESLKFITINPSGYSVIQLRCWTGNVLKREQSLVNICCTKQSDKQVKQISSLHRNKIQKFCISSNKLHNFHGTIFGRSCAHFKPREEVI